MKRMLLWLIVLLLPAIANAQLSVHFVATHNRGCAPLFVSFNDVSTGTITRWHWVFDTLSSADTSALQNPNWVYGTTGHYNVKLIVWDSSGHVDSLIIPNEVYVSPQPVIRFVADDTLLSCPPLTVHFTNLSDTGACVPNYTWFIDSSLIHSTNASYTFTHHGLYNITLSETDSCGCTAYLSKSNYIKIDSITVCFTSPDTTLCSPPARVYFNNCTSGATHYSWYFGDGSSDTSVNPCHIYSTSGIFTDSLVASSATGCTSFSTRTNYVSVGEYRVGFTTIPSSICINAPFTCYDTSYGGMYHHWQFSTITGDISNLISPTHIYTMSGITAIIDSTWNASGCNGKDTQYVMVNPLPIDSFSANNLYKCTPNDTVTFTPHITSSVGVASYLWSFGDSLSGGLDSSILAAPTHIYTSTDSFSIMLKVIDNNGCIAHDTIHDMINIRPTVDTIAVNSDSGCVPFTLVYHTFLTPHVSYITDSVSFGDGTSSMSDTGRHIYSITGYYNIIHYYHLPGACSYSDTLQIKAGNLPVIAPIAIPDSLCPLTQIVLVGNCTNCTSEIWNVEGGGGRANTDTFATFFTMPGRAYIHFFATDSGCTLNYNDSIYVHSPDVNFAISVPDCSDRFTYNFTNSSSGATSYHWSFGDGAFSNDENPHHTYSGFGTYTVSLSDTSAITHCYNRQKKVIHMDPFPTNFYSTDSVACKLENVLFVGPLTSFGAYYNQYSWIFGNGTSFFSPSYIYPRITDSAIGLYPDFGTYTVKLIIVDEYNCIDTITKLDFVHITGPTGGLRALSNVGCAPFTVHFTDSTAFITGIPIRNRHWQWNTGSSFDIGISSDTFHTYPLGNYTVILIDTDINGCSGADTIAIQSVKPAAYFYTPNTSVCRNVPVPFFDTNTHVSYTWYWGDGSSFHDTIQNPVHIYTANGIYTDSVVITTLAGGAYPVGCTSKYARSNYITISNHSVHLGFNLNDTFSRCPPLIILATNTSMPLSYYNYKWKFGLDSITINSTLTNPNYVYTNPGDYTITLIDSSIIGCIDSIKKTVHIGGPRGTLSILQDSICVSGNIRLQFTPTTTTALDSVYIWCVPPFGAFVTDTPSFTMYSYSIGSWLPYVIIDSSGCRVSVHTTDSIHILLPPTISINHPSAICKYSAVNLVATGASNYSWYPSTALTCYSCANTIASPLELTNYRVIGTTAPGCNDTAYTTVLIDTLHPVTITGKPAICFGNYDTLITSGRASSYYWAGSALSCFYCDTNSVHPDTNSTYYVIATDSLSCQDTFSFQVNVFPLPVITILPASPNVCAGSSVQLNAFGADSFSWTPNIDLSCNLCPNPISTINSSFIYSVSGTDNNGCIATIILPVGVINPVATSIIADTIICAGKSIQLFASGGKDDSDYYWLNMAGLSENFRYNPIASPDSSTNYKVVITENRCFKDTLSVIIKVAEIPLLTVNQSITTIAGTNLQLNAIVNNNIVVNYLWSPVTGLSCVDCANPIVTAGKNTVYTVTVTSANGCVAEGVINIDSYCDISEIFIPNTFTPENLDGLNDYFFVSGIGINLVKRMSIYDRLGECVFDKHNFQPNDPVAGWDGSYNNIKLAPDVFVYVIDVSCELGKTYHFTGDISIVK